MTVTEYLAGIAENIVHELKPILELKAVTSNSDLLGAYAEAVVRRLARRIVDPMHVSTGAVLDYPMPDPLRQIDVVIWAPFPAPGVFEVDNFALVPRSSAFGLLEIKRSNYSSKCEDRLEDFLERAPGIAAAPHPRVGDNQLPALGVVGVLESSPSARLQKLFDEGTAVALFDKTASEPCVRPRDVLKLVNFLHRTTWRYRMQAMQPDYPQLVDDLAPRGQASRQRSAN